VHMANSSRRDCAAVTIAAGTAASA